MIDIHTDNQSLDTLDDKSTLFPKSKVQTMALTFSTLSPQCQSRSIIDKEELRQKMCSHATAGVRCS